MSKTRMNPLAEIDPHLASRWSPRAFDPRRAVGREELLSCLEAARWAPSCFGDEPWRFIVADRFSENELENWKNILDALTQKNRAWAQHAPVLILACACKHFRNSERPNRWAEYDTGQAVLSLCIQATALGLATHQMGGFDEEMVRGHWGIPRDVQPMSVIALGHFGDDGVLDDDAREIERRARTRRPMRESVFSDRWKKPYFRKED